MQPWALKAECLVAGALATCSVGQTALPNYLHLCVLWLPPQLLRTAVIPRICFFLADFPPNFSGMKFPGACNALQFCSGLQKYSSKPAFEGGQGQTSLPINTSETLQTLLLPIPHAFSLQMKTLTACWHYPGLLSHQLPDLRNRLPFSGVEEKSDPRSLGITCIFREAFIAWSRR